MWNLKTWLSVIEDKIVTKDCDWLNNNASYHLTANKKPGTGKRKRVWDNESECVEFLHLTEKMGGGPGFLVV